MLKGARALGRIGPFLGKSQRHVSVVTGQNKSYGHGPLCPSGSLPNYLEEKEGYHSALTATSVVHFQSQVIARCIRHIGCPYEKRLTCSLCILHQRPEWESMKGICSFAFPSIDNIIS